MGVDRRSVLPLGGVYSVGCICGESGVHICMEVLVYS